MAVRDLRVLPTLTRIGRELERIGDSVANMARRVRQLAPDAPLEGHLGVPGMRRPAAQFLAETMRARPTPTPHGPSPSATTRSTCSTIGPLTA